MAWPRLILAVAAVAVIGGCSGTVAGGMPLYSQPAGADIFVNGQRTGDKTPCDGIYISGEEGEYIVSVRKAGYVESKTKIILKRVPYVEQPDRVDDVLRSFCFCPPAWPCLPFVLLAPKPQWELHTQHSFPLTFLLQESGQGITICTGKDNYSVFLDGLLIGKTVARECDRDGYVIEVSELIVPVNEPGSHTVELKAGDHLSWKDTIEIEKDCYYHILVTPGR
jgi:hypothetical protein